MGHDFRRRLQALADELRARGDVRVDEVWLGAPLTDADLATVQRATGGAPLPDGLEALHRELDGFRLRWTHHDGDEGSINLLPLADVFASGAGRTWFADVPGSESARPVKPIDIFVAEACAALRLEPESRIADSVHLHFFGEGGYDTGYRFLEYFDRLLAARGYLYWMKTLCAELKDDAVVRKFRERMPQLFAGYDDSLFRPRSARS